MQEVTKFLLARLSGRPFRDGLWLLLANLLLAAAFVLLMLSMLAGGGAVALKPWMVILGMAVASVVLWYYFGKCLPSGQRFGQIAVMVTVGMSPVVAPTVHLYLRELTSGCHGAEVLMMAWGPSPVPSER